MKIYEIWNKTAKRYVDSINFADGESLKLAITPEGDIIQYGSNTDHRIGKIDNPEEYEIHFIE